MSETKKVIPNKRVIIGHSRQIKALSRLSQNKLLPSALLFSGPGGVGKYLLAHELAGALLCENPSAATRCHVCHACRLVDSGNHPDLIVLDANQREEASTDRTRELLHSLGLRSFQGGARIIIVRSAEFLALQAANALLKSLEEPRPGNHFILVTDSADRLPATVRSRCQQWCFGPLSDTELQQVLELSHLKLSSELIGMSDGSVARAHHIQAAADEIHNVRSQLGKIMGGDVDAAIVLAQQLASDRDTLRQRLEHICMIARAILRQHLSTDQYARVAVFLHNIIEADPLISERHLNPTALLSYVFATLLPTDVSGLRHTLTHSQPLLSALIAS